MKNIRFKRILAVIILVAMIGAPILVNAVPIGNDTEYIPFPRNLGVGDDTPDKKLVVNGDASIIGTIQITGGSPIAGYVLTTDATGLATWQAVSVNNTTINNATSQNGTLINGTILQSIINNSTITNTSFTGGVINGTNLISQNDLKVIDDGTFGDSVTARAFIGQVFNGGVFRGDGSGLTGITAANVTGTVPNATNAVSAMKLRAPDGSPDTAVSVNNNGDIGIGISNPAVKLDVNGTVAFRPSSSTVAVTAATTIAPISSVLRVQGVGGPVNITAVPQIAPGIDGQILVIRGTSNTNSVKFDDGTGLALANASFILGNQDTIYLIFDSANQEWVETSRSDN